MSKLDNLESLSAIDPSGMMHRIESFPEQFKEAADMAAGIDITLRSRARSVVVAGMGGSAIGAEVIRTAMAGALRVPLLVHRDYELPAFVDSATLVIASSHSGNTEETLHCYRMAAAAGASLVCITSGGKLGAMGNRDGHPVVTFPGGMPPRSALGYSSMMLLGVLRSVGLVNDPAEDVQETAPLLSRLAESYAPGIPAARNPAKQLAAALQGRIPIIYGAGGTMGAAAVRWRGQIEENAKRLAFHHTLPEMNHNELVGWEGPKPLLQDLAVVFLRDRGDHGQVQKRFDLTREIVASRAGVVREVWGEGISLMARLFSVILLGDFLSVYLACLDGTDPSPVKVIDHVKERLTT